MRLLPERRCISIDLPGHGPTRPNGEASVFGLADAVGTVIDQLNLHDIHLVGNDTGGAVSQVVLTRDPARFRTFALTNCDTEGNFPPPAFRPAVWAAKTGLLRLAAKPLMGMPTLAEQIYRTGYQNISAVPDDASSPTTSPPTHAPTATLAVTAPSAAFRRCKPAHFPHAIGGRRTRGSIFQRGFPTRTADELFYNHSAFCRYFGIPVSVWGYVQVAAVLDVTTRSPEAMLRAAVDAVVDPQALLESVRDDEGRIVDFAFRELNPSACAYLLRSKAELLGGRLTELVPEMLASGLLPQYAHAMETGEPLEVEDFPLFSHRYDTVRRFDVRAMRATADWLSVVWRDVTDRHRAQRFADIEFSEAARDLLRVSSDALLDPLVLLRVVTDSDGKVVDFVYREVNQATCDYLGLSRTELIGRGLLELSPGVAQTGLFADYVRCLRTGEPVVHDDLSYDNEILVDTRRYDLRATRATASAIGLTWRDVTDRYRAPQGIIAAQQNYRLIAENAGDLVLHIRDGRFAWVSPSVGGVLGGSPDYWAGRELREIIPADDRPAHVHRLKTVTEGGVVTQRVRLVGLDGVTHWFHLHAKPFHDVQGRRDGHTATLRLIDDEVVAEQALEAARQEQGEADSLYRRAIDNAAVGMCLVTPEGHLSEVNAAMGRMFGRDAREMNGTRWQDFTAPEFLEVETANFQGILQGRIDSYRMVKHYVHADGHRIWGDLSVSAIRDENGHIQKLLGLLVDVTARVEADERNRRLALQLQQESNQRAAQSVSFGGTAMEIGGHSDPLTAVHSQLEALWSIHPLIPDGVRIQVQIATAEVAANIVEHTGIGHPLRIRMSASVINGQVHIEFTDNGPPADIDLTTVAMPDDMAERGRGLAMSQALLDLLAFRCDETGNHWTLISKHFP